LALGADGSIPAEQVAILKELKRWTAKHKEAVYGTRAGLDARFVREKNAFSKDGKTMYVYIDALQKDIIIGGMHTKPKDVRLVGEAGSLNFVYDGYAARVQLPKGKLDSVASVVAIDFDQQPRFELAAVETQPSLASLSGGKDARETIRQIVRWTDSGANLFQNKTTEDGEWIDSTISFSNQVRQWLSKHAEVLAFANKGLPTGHYNGFSALSKDRQTLYLFVDGTPTGPIAIKGLKNTIARIRIVGEGSMIGHQVFNKLYWSQVPGIVYIDVPKERLDRQMTAIAVLLDKPLELYREEVGAIESNL